VASDSESKSGTEPDGENTPITHPEARLWASLFNVRYRMLLTDLTHTFDYAGSLDQSSQMSPRGLLIHSTFGEMYNLRAISMILVQTPLNQTGRPLVAGPPFQMPFTLDLPLDDIDRWQLHLDLIEGSNRLVDMLVAAAPKPRHAYLKALLSSDQQCAKGIQKVIEGLSVHCLVRSHH
jgi:hypothetical protein